MVSGLSSALAGHCVLCSRVQMLMAGTEGGLVRGSLFGLPDRWVLCISNVQTLRTMKNGIRFVDWFSTRCGGRSSSLCSHRTLFWQQSRDENLQGSGMSHATTASPKPSFRALWRVGDAVVGRRNADAEKLKTNEQTNKQTSKVTNVRMIIPRWDTVDEEIKFPSA